MGWLTRTAAVVAVFLIPRPALAHFTEGFEAGADATTDECWHLDGAQVSAVTPLSGAYSVRTSPLSAGADRVVDGPWVALDGFGSLSFRHRVDGLGDGGLSIEVTLVDSGGHRTSLFGQTYATTAVTVSQIPLPMTGIYRSEFRFAGAGAGARAYLDDAAFPAVEFSDRTTNDGSGMCMPLECLSSLDCVGKGVRTLCDFANYRCVECRAVNDCEDLDPCTDDRCVMNRCESTDLCVDAGADADGGGDGGSVPDADGGPSAGAPDGATPADAGRYVTHPRRFGRASGGGCGMAGATLSPVASGALWVVFGLLTRRRRPRSPRS